MAINYTQNSSWPFQEAKKLLARSAQKPLITFETGYGPSGLPHIGTFGEVVRTSMVRHAFSCLSSTPTRLLCFSDDMDGLRKVPDNIPNPEKLAPFLNLPLTKVPDPFGKFESFGEHNNHKLQEFLNELGVDYTFMSSTACYRAGMFDQALLEVLQHHQEILDLILPTLGPERRKTYSPFLPISPTTGRVLQVPIEEYRESTIIFRDEDGRLTEQSVTGGLCKLQWKVDWGMRWKVLGVDYEMAGKDLIDSVYLATRVNKIIKGTPPEAFIYEHFLDHVGGKISKSKGNGLSVEEWLSYGPMESLAYFMYQSPKRAKRLYFDVIPRHVDDYLQHLAAFPDQDEQAQASNPVWSVHSGTPPHFSMLPLTFTLLLNLASVCQGQERDLLWRFIMRVYPHLSAQTHPFIDQLVGHAVRYYHDKVAPFKSYRSPTDHEKKALLALAQRLNELDSHTPEAIQHHAYEVGKLFFDDLKTWFACFYEVLMGQPNGPRVGSFIALYGPKETQALIAEKLGS
jgi:lysyl-tRNA synthetase class 1